MPEITGQSPQRNWFQRAMGEAVDRLFLANRGHDFQTGQWDGRGAWQGGVQSVLGAINPAAGLAARFAFNRMNANRPMQIQRQQFPVNFGTQVGNASFNGLGPMQQAAQTPWTPLGTQAGNVVNGGQLGSWANGSQPLMNPYAYASGNRSSAGGARGYRGGGITGDAARAMFEGMSDSSRFNTSMSYLNTQANS